MSSPYLRNLYAEMEEAYSRWLWYYREPVTDRKKRDTGVLLAQSEKEFLRLCKKYNLAAKEEGY